MIAVECYASCQLQTGPQLHCQLEYSLVTLHQVQFGVVMHQIEPQQRLAAKEQNCQIFREDGFPHLKINRGEGRLVGHAVWILILFKVV